MKSLSFDTMRCLLVGGVSVTLVAGCGGVSPLGIEAPRDTQTSSVASKNGAMAHTASSSKYKVHGQLLFVTNFSEYYNDVRVYRANAKDPAPLATITKGINTPTGDCIDAQGTLYVMNEPASGPGWVSEYPLGETTPSKIVTDGVNTPAFCAIDANGNLWITNIGAVNATEYLPGSKKPYAVITSGLKYPVGIAIDDSGNLYIGNGGGGPKQNIEVYAPGEKSPSRTITDGVTWPVGITVDSNQTLYVANVTQNNITEFRSGQSDPFQVITKGASGPTGVTVNENGTLYVADLGNESQQYYNTVTEYAAGSANPLKRRISKDLFDPEGVAYYPPLLP